ncbi:hypothetical protein SNEBB_001363 [Seison nebaliae]|nr:hypothetical protein SNEBB_001363 [Seison nebaliae]
MNMKRPFIIGVAGGTASGKSSVCKKIIEKLTGYTDNLTINNISANKANNNNNSNNRRGNGGRGDICSAVESDHRIATARVSNNVAYICGDSFYKELNEQEAALANNGNFNFDHPLAFDFELLHKTLLNVCDGKPTIIPTYDFTTNSRSIDIDPLTIRPPIKIIIVEGILVFFPKELRSMYDLKIFVDSDADTRLSRRVRRDMKDRGRTLEHVLHQYQKYVKPAFDEFCSPTKKYADVIIPRGAENYVAINLVVQYLRESLETSVHSRDRHRNDCGDYVDNDGKDVNRKKKVDGDQSSNTTPNTLRGNRSPVPPYRPH